MNFIKSRLNTTYVSADRDVAVFKVFLFYFPLTISIWTYLGTIQFMYYVVYWIESVFGSDVNGTLVGSIVGLKAWLNSWIDDNVVLLICYFFLLFFASLQLIEKWYRVSVDVDVVDDDAAAECNQTDIISVSECVLCNRQRSIKREICFVFSLFLRSKYEINELFSFYTKWCRCTGSGRSVLLPTGLQTHNLQGIIGISEAAAQVSHEQQPLLHSWRRTATPGGSISSPHKFKINLMLYSEWI